MKPVAKGLRNRIFRLISVYLKLSDPHFQSVLFGLITCGDQCVPCPIILKQRPHFKAKYHKKVLVVEGAALDRYNKIVILTDCSTGPHPAPNAE